jgi:hypothetical protein
MATLNTNLQDSESPERSASNDATLDAVDALEGDPMAISYPDWMPPPPISGMSFISFDEAVQSVISLRVSMAILSARGAQR